MLCPDTVPRRLFERQCSGSAIAVTSRDSDSGSAVESLAQREAKAYTAYLESNRKYNGYMSCLWNLLWLLQLAHLTLEHCVACMALRNSKYEACQQPLIARGLSAATSHWPDTSIIERL